MSRTRSAVVLIVVPAAISLVVTMLVLTLWERLRSTEPTVITLPTISPTSQVEPRDTLPPAPTDEEPSDSTDAPPDQGSDPGEPTEQAAEGTPCDNPIHTVASGEVLGAISEAYGVTVGELIEMNLMLDPEFNPDFLSVGQELVVPVCGVPTPTIAPPTEIPTNTVVPTRNIPAPIPTATSLPPGTISVQIEGVISPGEINREAIEVVNLGSPVDLGHWTLRDEDDNEFEFPSFRLFASGGVRVYTRVGENTPIDLFWNLDEAVWEIGETVFLYDDEGELQDEFEITADD